MTWTGELSLLHLDSVLTSSGVPESMDENSKVSMKLDVHGTPAENLQRLITDCGVSPLKVGRVFAETLRRI